MPVITGALSAGQLLDRAFRLYRARFARMLTLSAIFQLPVAILTGIATGQILNSQVELVQALLAQPGSAALVATPGSASSASDSIFFPFLAFLLGTVALLLCSLALTSDALEALCGRDQPISQSVRKAFRRFWPMLGMDLLRLLLFGAGAFILGLAFLFFIGFQTLIVGLAAALLTGNSALESILLVGVTLLLVLFTIVITILLLTPLAYLHARWFIAIAALVDQLQGPRRTLGISWQLTKNSAMRIFVIALLLWLLSLTAVTLPISLLQSLELIVMASGTAQVSIGVIGAVAGVILNVLWQPLHASTVVLLYFDQRVRHESYDLSLRLAALEADMAAQSTSTPQPLPEEIASDA